MKYIRTIRYCFGYLRKSLPVLHCIGDSHVESFFFVAKKRLLTNTKIKFCVVPGATNMGLANPHSKTQAMPIFVDYLRTIVAGDRVLFCLGEVDCGFVIWYRAEKYGTPVEEQFDLSLANYYGLIDLYLEEIPASSVFVLSVPLPTIRDDQLLRGEVANKRLGINASQKQRTELTIAYNAQLERFCANRGVVFLDLQKDTLDRATGVVATRFLNKDETDHHLEPSEISPIIVSRLNGYGFQ